ncbi:YbaB/EbfC family nucleoid-associated protein [Desulfofalx alkaliphila]|uniref:YbaB/EbfC family nucleoid-associated protein n=1 Tax=Desulfofalx alkaliphila TaxID=105483 RepID=UPI0004E165CF|nr:YbaB/EbfC family nucleoid-associated protein [Desulfofalx alkaliphila]
MLGNMGQIMNQIQKIQDEIQRMTVEVTSSDGAVMVVMNGKQEVVSVVLNQQAIRNLEVSQLENSMVEVLNNAMAQSRAAVKDKLSQVTGLNINGLMNMFT